MKTRMTAAEVVADCKARGVYWHSVPEAAQMLGVTPYRLQQTMLAGHLPYRVLHVQHRGRVLDEIVVEPAALDEYRRVRAE